MGMVLTNRASSLLSTNINIDTTAIAITSGDEGAFPALGVGEWCPVVIVDAAGNYEVVRCTARSGVNLTIVRGQEGTSPIAFTAGARVDVRLTAGALIEQTQDAARLLTGEIPDATLPDRLKIFAALSTDADTIAATGFYRVASDAANLPIAAAGFIWQSSIDADTAFQEYQAASGLLRYLRQRVAGAWGSWTQTYQPPVATSIASATTTDLATATGENVIITGNVTIVAFGNVAAGIRRHVSFTGTPLLTHHAANMILWGAANIQVTAGDQAVFESLGTGKWKMVGFHRFGAGADGRLATDTLVGVVEKATAAEIAAATADKYLDAEVVKTASVKGDLTDAATVAFDWAAKINFDLTITADRVLGNPSNGQPRTYRTILAKGSSATARALTFGSSFKGEILPITDLTSTRWYLLTICCIATDHYVVSSLIALKPA